MERAFYSIDGLNFNSTINYVKKAALREFANINITEVHRYPLSRSDLFSSRSSQSVLVISRDFKIRDATEQQIKTAQCGMLMIQNKIRKNKVTEFIALVFPDKTTVYSDFITESDYSDLSIISKIESTPNLNVTQLFASFKKSVKNGVVDFYLPNDTHCGSFAYKMAASEVLRLINHGNDTLNGTGRHDLNQI